MADDQDPTSPLDDIPVPDVDLASESEGAVTTAAAVDPLRCGTCGKGPFSNTWALTGHMRSHAPKAPKQPKGKRAAPHTPDPATPSGPRLTDAGFPIIPLPRQTSGPKRARRYSQVVRAPKMAQPTCQVLSEPDENGKRHPIPGPCVEGMHSDDLDRVGSWFPRCDHAANETGVSDLAPGIAPYFEESLLVVEESIWTFDERLGYEIETGTTKRRVRIRRPRITQVPLDVSIMSGQGMTWARERGFRPLSDLGLPPMCEFWNCWSTDVFGPDGRRKFRNGYFCTEMEAKLIWAKEHREFINAEMPPEADPLQSSMEIREEQLARINV